MFGLILKHPRANSASWPAGDNVLLTTLMFRWNLPQATSAGHRCVTRHKLTHLADAFPVPERGGEQEEKGAPVCVLRCLCSSSLRVNLLPQNIQLQTKGRSPECQRRCARRCDVFPYTFPQPTMWQMCCFFLPVPDPLRTGKEKINSKLKKSYGPLSVHLEAARKLCLLTVHPTLCNWGTCTPPGAAACPPDPAGPRHPPGGRGGGTDRWCWGWSRRSAATRQSRAPPLSECLGRRRRFNSSFANGGTNIIRSCTCAGRANYNFPSEQRHLVGDRL